MEHKFQIGEFAARAGVTPRTVRYYESLGLIASIDREKRGFRYYTEAELDRLQKIVRMTEVGLSLDEIAEIIDLLVLGADHEIQGKRKIAEILKNHLADIDQKISNLEELRRELRQNLTLIEQFIDGHDDS